MADHSRVFIIGGTGFIGSHISLLAIEQKLQISILNRSLPASPDLFPESVKFYKGDASLLHEDEMAEMFQNHDALVYAIGADDTIIPPIPAYPFYFHYNVETTARVYRSAKKAGIKRMIILGSYFCYFNRLWPDMHLPEYHPYIRSRVEQEKFAIENSSPDLQIMVLELPYIFGSTKGRIPLWKPLLDYVLSGMPLFYMKGGSIMISVKQVAEAVIGAVKWGKGGECYPIGDQNMTWSELLNKILASGKKKKKVRIVPDWLLKTAGAIVYFLLFIIRKESGLHPRIFMQMQIREAFFDPAPAQKALHFQGGGLDEAIRETVHACYPGKYDD